MVGALDAYAVDRDSYTSRCAPGIRPGSPRPLTAVALVSYLSATVFPLDFVNAALDVVQSTFGTNTSR